MTMLRRQLDVYESRLQERALSWTCTFGNYQDMDIKAMSPAEMTKGMSMQKRTRVQGHSKFKGSQRRGRSRLI